MDFRVYVIVEVPIIDKKYEILVPIDRRIHDLVTILKKAIPELNTGYYENNTPNIYNKSSGEMYEINTLIKRSGIKTGTRLLLV